MIPVTTVGQVREYLAPYGDDVRFASSYDGSKPAVISTSMMADCEGEDLKNHGDCEYHDTLVVFISRPQETVVPTPRTRLAYMPVRGLLEGDAVDLEDLAEKYGAPEGEKITAEHELAIVESVTVTEVSDGKTYVKPFEPRMLVTDQGTYVLPHDEMIPVYVV